MKDRIFNYINILDRLSHEINKYNDLVLDNITKIKDGEEDDTLYKDCFVYNNYISLLYMDVQKNIDKLTECYINSISQGVVLGLTKEEQDVIDKYMKESEEIFVLFKGEIVPKTANLLTIMRERASEMDKQEWFESYKKSIINK